jgi:hypothetical protein
MAAALLQVKLLFLFIIQVRNSGCCSVPIEASVLFETVCGSIASEASVFVDTDEEQ